MSVGSVVAVVLAGLVLLSVVSAVVALWVPDGGVVTTFRREVHRTGASRRAVLSAAVLLFPVALPLLTARGVGLAWAVAGGVYVGGVLVGTVAVVNRPRAQLLERAAPVESTSDGPCVASGPAQAADSGPLVAPVTGRPAVCYTTAVVEYVERPIRGGGANFVTQFDVERVPFAVAVDSTTVEVDPEGAWISLSPASPTDLEVDVEGALTGGSADTEVVVAEGEPVPGHLLEPFEAQDLPVSSDGTAQRRLRFKESAAYVGEDVTAVGRAETSTEFGTTRVVCDVPGAFVTDGGVDRAADSLGSATTRNLFVGVALAVVGSAGLVVVAGLV